MFLHVKKKKKKSQEPSQIHFLLEKKIFLKMFSRIPQKM